MLKDLQANAKTFINTLTSNEEWLMSRVLAYAKQHGYTQYTSTLREAWRLSVHGLSGSIAAMATSCKGAIPELHVSTDFQSDPASEFGVSEARKHRERGVPIPMFMGLMKYYRQAYSDLLGQSSLLLEAKNHFQQFTNRAFDIIEIAYITEWSGHDANEGMKEMQAANRHLSNEKNKYLTIFEGFYSPLIILNSENSIVNFNMAASELFSDINEPGTIYYNRERSSEALKFINSRLAGFIKGRLQELAFETYLETNKGKRFFLVKLKKIVDFSDKFSGTIIILDDLTERREMERQLEIAKDRAEEADRLKTAFLSNMSHEIRTPMNAIIGFSDLMLNDAFDDADRNTYLQIIQKSGNNLLKLIDDIIDIAKIESKQLTINAQECSIEEICLDLQTMFDELLRKEDKAIELLLDIDNSFRGGIITDPDRLKQVFSNLISNAIKFTSEGYVQFGYKNISRKNLVCYVKDTGIGIPREKQEFIFNRFSQLETSYTKQLGGTGLGLAITRNIVHLLGGNIWVESDVGKGSTFYFILPVKYLNSYDGTKKGLPLSFPERNVSLKGFTLLIAEDEQMNFFYLNEILKKTGVKILWAKNGLEAVNLTEANPDIDLVMMDIKMPEINGLEAIKYIRAIRPNLPIVAQTAYVMDNDREVCLRAGCTDFLPKPIKPNQLFGVIIPILKEASLATSKVVVEKE